MVYWGVSKMKGILLTSFLGFVLCTQFVFAEEHQLTDPLVDHAGTPRTAISEPVLTEEDLKMRLGPYFTSINPSTNLSIVDRIQRSPNINIHLFALTKDPGRTDVLAVAERRFLTAAMSGGEAGEIYLAMVKGGLIPAGRQKALDTILEDILWGKATARMTAAQKRLLAVDREMFKKLRHSGPGTPGWEAALADVNGKERGRESFRNGVAALRAENYFPPQFSTELGRTYESYVTDSKERDVRDNGSVLAKKGLSDAAVARAFRQLRPPTTNAEADAGLTTIAEKLKSNNPVNPNGVKELMDEYTDRVGFIPPATRELINHRLFELKAKDITDRIKGDATLVPDGPEKEAMKSFVDSAKVGAGIIASPTASDLAKMQEAIKVIEKAKASQEYRELVLDGLVNQHIYPTNWETYIRDSVREASASPGVSSIPGSTGIGAAPVPHTGIPSVFNSPTPGVPTPPVPGMVGMPVTTIPSVFNGTLPGAGSLAEADATLVNRLELTPSGINFANAKNKKSSEFNGQPINYDKLPFNIFIKYMKNPDSVRAFGALFSEADSNPAIKRKAFDAYYEQIASKNLTVTDNKGRQHQVTKDFLNKLDMSIPENRNFAHQMLIEHSPIFKENMELVSEAKRLIDNNQTENPKVRAAFRKRVLESALGRDFLDSSTGSELSVSDRATVDSAFGEYLNRLGQLAQ
jgi:hypothetical protein